MISTDNFQCSHRDFSFTLTALYNLQWSVLFCRETREQKFVCCLLMHRINVHSDFYFLVREKQCSVLTF